MNYGGKIEWDITKPKGQLRKPSLNSKLLNLGWSTSDYTPLDVALKKSCDWFKEKYPNVRGIE